MEPITLVPFNSQCKAIRVRYVSNSSSLTAVAVVGLLATRANDPIRTHSQEVVELGHPSSSKVIRSLMLISREEGFNRKLNLTQFTTIQNLRQLSFVTISIQMIQLGFVSTPSMLYRVHLMEIPWRTTALPLKVQRVSRLSNSRIGRKDEQCVGITIIHSN